MRVRGWHWIVIVAGSLAFTVLAGAIALRVEGRRRWDAHAAALRAQGRPTTVAEYLATAPAVDAGRQADWEAWLSTVPGHLPTTAGPDWQAFLAGGAPPAGLQAWSTAQAGMRARGMALLREGAVIGSFGRAHLRGPGPYSVDDLAAMAGPSSLLAVRGLATAALVEAALADDPYPALRDLELLGARTGSGSLSDLMVHGVGDALRDQAWLEAVARGRSDVTGTAAWIAERPDLLARLADGYAAERLRIASASAESLARGERRTVTGSWRSGILGWLDCHQCAVVLSAHEDAVRTGSALPPASPWVERWLEMTRIVAGTFPTAYETTVLIDARRRAARACAAIRLGGWRSVADLPPEVHALLRPAPGRLALAAGFIPGHVVVTVDPAAPLPPAIAMWRTSLATPTAPAHGTMLLQAGAQIALP